MKAAQLRFSLIQWGRGFLVDAAAAETHAASGAWVCWFANNERDMAERPFLVLHWVRCLACLLDACVRECVSAGAV